MDPAIKAAIQSAKRHRRRYAPNRARAEDMVRAYRAVLVPRMKPGVEADPETVRGAAIYRQGLEDYDHFPNPPLWPEYRDRLWRKVYAAVLPGFNAMDKYERKGRTDAVRKNVKAYLQRRGFKLTPDKRGRRKSCPSN